MFGRGIHPVYVHFHPVVPGENQNSFIFMKINNLQHFQKSLSCVKKKKKLNNRSHDKMMDLEIAMTEYLFFSE
jgi:hypothetical protein